MSIENGRVVVEIPSPNPTLHVEPHFHFIGPETQLDTSRSTAAAWVDVDVPRELFEYWQQKRDEAVKSGDTPFVGVTMTEGEQDIFVGGVLLGWKCLQTAGSADVDVRVRVWLQLSCAPATLTTLRYWMKRL